MVSGVSDAFYLSVVLGQENSILVLSLRAAGYYPILLTVSYLYEKDLLFISQVGVTGEMKYKMFNSTELSQNLDYTIDSFTAVPDLSIDTLTNAQIEQVFSNLGVVVAIVEPSDTNGSQLSEARTTQLSNARILLRTETGIPYVLVSNAMDGSSTVYIWAALSSSGTRFDTLTMRVPPTGRGAMGISNIPFRDSTAIKYTKQYLNTAYQEIARSNINVKSVEELLADDDFIAQLKTKLGIA